MPKKKVAKPKKKTTSVKKKTLTKKKPAKKVKAKTKKVTPIPKGYSSITPYLIINNASKAIDYYKKIFGAKEVFRMEREGGNIGHAELKIGDSKIMLADECPEMGEQGYANAGSAISIHLYIKNVDEVVQKAVGQGAKLVRPVADMFYGDRSGCVEDPFGHTWFISTHIEDLTPAKLKKRAAEAFKSMSAQN